VGYGGNTSCIEVVAGDDRIILDAGTGLRELGGKLLKDGVKRATLLLTHTHWDHINGFPFFAPAFREEFELRVMAGHLKSSGGVRAALEGQMTQPMFPVPLQNLQANIDFVDFEAGESFTVGESVSVMTAPLNHPNGATGYRMEFGNKVLCYITDTEHVPGKLDEAILELIAGADLVIYDSTYTDDEFPLKVGWGHSTWQEGIRLCQKAGAKQLAIFHHDPDHEDEFMAKVEADAKATWEGAIVAREGMKIILD
jgi:phosphoribosyl 1,2-cyclic phosphodiesterase